MLDNKKIGVIGTGNMGRALIGGLINSGSSVSENIVCSDIKEGKLKKIEEEFGVVTRDNNSGVARESEIIIYAVKPQIMAPVLKETGDCLDMSKIVISIAAGVPLAAIESCLGKELRVIRVMPNVPALIMEGASAVAAGRNALAEDLTLAKAIFDSVGKSVIIEEELMDAVTGLSGSGPAYIFLIIDALSDAGVKVGLAREDAIFLVALNSPASNV